MEIHYCLSFIIEQALFDIIHQYKTGTEFLIASNCYRLLYKNHVLVPLVTLRLQYEPPETSENARFSILRAVSYWFSKHSLVTIPKYTPSLIPFNLTHDRNY